MCAHAMEVEDRVCSSPGWKGAGHSNSKKSEGSLRLGFGLYFKVTEAEFTNSFLGK